MDQARTRCRSTTEQIVNYLTKTNINYVEMLIETIILHLDACLGVGYAI